MPKYTVDGEPFILYPHAPNMDIDSEIKGIKVRISFDKKMNYETPERLLRLSRAIKVEDEI